MDVRQQLDTTFNPRSIAVVGASTNKTKFGYQILEMLTGVGFTGGIYPINPHASEILGLPCYKSLSELPESPDIVALLIPADTILGVVADCVARKIPCVVIISSGFAEAGEAGKKLQEELRELIKGTATRIIGPNCQGVINVSKRLSVSFSSMYQDLKRGPISIVSQSGAYCGILARRASKLGVGIAKIISSGNEADLSAIDYLKYLADDPETKVILAYLEEMKKPAQFKECLAGITAKKPVVIQKAGRTRIGSTAVSSHTGSLAGSDKVISRLLQQNGVVRVSSINELIYAGLGLATQPLVKGNRLAVISGVGGLAVETSELSVEAGLSIPKLTDSTRERLESILPNFASCNNPVDMTGGAYGDPGMVGRALTAVLEDPGIDAVLFILTITRSVEFAQVVYETMQRGNKPILMCWTAGIDVTPEPIKYLAARDVPIFESPEQLVSAVSAIVQYSRYRLGKSFITKKEQ